MLPIIVMLIAPYLVLLAACEPQADIRTEAYLALEQMYNVSIQTIDVDIAHIDQFLNDVEAKETNLAQIIALTQLWVAQKKAADYSGLPCG